MRIHGNGIRVAERAANDHHTRSVGSLGKSAPSRDCFDNRHVRSESGRTRQPDFPDHINLTHITWGEVNVISRLNRNILRQIALAKQPLEIERKSPTTASQKAALKIR